jgi:hypothetical protein
MWCRCISPRPTVERDGQIIAVDGGHMRLREGERPLPRLVRFRSLGCYALTGLAPARSVPRTCRSGRGRCSAHRLPRVS